MVLLADCLQLASDIELQLFKPPDVDSDDPNIAAPGWVWCTCWVDGRWTVRLNAVPGVLSQL